MQICENYAVEKIKERVIKTISDLEDFLKKMSGINTFESSAADTPCTTGYFSCKRNKKIPANPHTFQKELLKSRSCY